MPWLSALVLGQACVPAVYARVGGWSSARQPSRVWEVLDPNCVSAT